MRMMVPMPMYMVRRLPQAWIGQTSRSEHPLEMGHTVLLMMVAIAAHNACSSRIDVRDLTKGAGCRQVDARACVAGGCVPRVTLRRLGCRPGLK